jgi:nucleotide-binding universal stress UspA family protein
MSIVCVTNLSAQSIKAGNAAAALASRLREPLVLFRVAEHEGASGEGTPAHASLRGRLEAEAERLRALGVQVRTVSTSRVEEALANDGECRKARWVVLAADGWESSLWRRAPLPERLARHALAPLLVVRKESVLADWARGRRRLLVMVGVDAASDEHGPVELLHALRAVGPCDVIATYVCQPPEERRRLGIHSPVHVEMLDPVVRGLQALDPQVERVLLRELRERVGALPGEGSVELRLEPGYGRREDHLLHVARERGVDLLVVGTHPRAALQRWWHGSVSAGVLRHCEQSVVCVPPLHTRTQRASPPRSVLVPVDFSAPSLRAVSQARLLVGPGGRIHLLHVHPRRLSDPDWTDHYGVLPEPPAEREAVLRRLRALVPADDTAVRWSVEGVSAREVALAICQASEREGVDLVCVGAVEARGSRPTGITRELLARCHRPVLVVPSPAEGREPRGWGSVDLQP